MTQLGAYTLDLEQGPRVMGILNVTPDSFSDGNLYLDPLRAEEQALRLEVEGADILDIGGESSRPGSESVTWETEWSRLEPVLRRIIPHLKIPISIDTSKFEVAERALAMGVVMINDIHGLRRDIRLAKLVNQYRAGVVLMHLRGTPRDMQAHTQYANVVQEVIEVLQQSLKIALDHGISREQIVVDPGIGFGKTSEQNHALLRGIANIKRELRCPVLIGISRKRFIRNTGVSESLSLAHAALHALALERGAQILRVHDVAECRRVIELCRAPEGAITA